MVEANQEKSCIHHWEIESPNGAESQGVCAKCGELKLFKNFLAIGYVAGESSGVRFNKNREQREVYEARQAALALERMYRRTVNHNGDFTW